MAAFGVGPAIRYGVEGYPDAVVVGDVIGDRRPDIVISAQNLVGEAGCFVHVFEQRPDGMLASPVKIPYSLYAQCGGLELADLDHSGKSEIVVGDHQGLTLIRRGDGQFVTTMVPGDIVADSLGILDVDADGNYDVFAQSWYDGARLYLGDGRGGVREVRSLDTSASGYNTVEVRDFSDDGYPDVVLTNAQGFSKAWMYANHPVAGLQAGVEFDLSQTLRYPPWGMTVADFDRDGRTDMAVSDRGNSVTFATGVRIFYRTSSGGLGDSVLLPIRDEPGPVAVADLDGNGLPDVVTMINGYNTMAYFLQQASGFAVPVQLATSPPNYTFNSFYGDNSLAIAHVNSDRCLDIVVADANYGLVVFPGHNCLVRPPRTGGNTPPSRLR